MRKTLFLIFCWSALILLGNVISNFAQQKSQTSSVEDLQKQKKAEQVVIRAMQIFGQTLDFNKVYRETYVKDKAVRQGEIDSMKKSVEKESPIKIDRKLSKQLYVKTNNTIWLVMLCVFEEKFSDNTAKIIISKFNKRQKELYARIMIGEESEPFFKSNAEIINGLSAADIAANVIRKHLPQKLRQNMQRKVTIDTFKVSEIPEDKPYLSKYKNFYEITTRVNKKWLNLTFTVVEESGVMKILSFTITDD